MVWVYMQRGDMFYVGKVLGIELPGRRKRRRPKRR